MENFTHTASPVFNEDSEVLILGTFPSVKSREARFFYGHPQNRFWKVISAVTGCSEYDTVEKKKKMLLDNRIALWDTIKSCDVKGSSDSSITNVVPSDLREIMEVSHIKRIYCNGDKAYRLYNKYHLPYTGIEAVKLPSTSPANAKFTLDKLIEEWKVII